MEARESAALGPKSSHKDLAVKEKVLLHRKWMSEPSAASTRSTLTEPESKHRESSPCGAPAGSAPQQKFAMTGNSGKLLSGPSAVGAVGGPSSRDPQGPFAQGFPRGYSYQLGQPYPQHPQSERFLSGAKPQPGLEPHAWPFAGQLPSDDLYPVGHPGRAHPHGGGRFPRQKSPSLPGSFGQYSGPEPGEEGYGKKEQKPKKLGKYKCNYCGRACAKPSVLKKHIRSHTGERPYPCVPCGFSFKTKSNLYKHRKSHAHAIKAGLVPFSELSAARCGDRASPGGEAEVQSDGEQSTDTDEEGVDGSTVLMDKDSPIPQISFQPDKSTGGVEPAYADSAEELSMGSIKVPILVVPLPAGVPSPGMECPSFQDIKGSHHMLGGRARSLDDCPSIKPRLAQRLTERAAQDADCAASQSLNLLSPHSKGSTDSGYFSRSESAEQTISPPNANAKTYEEIMFGRTWYYRPGPRSRQSIAVGMAGADPAGLAGLKQSGALLEMGKICEDQICFRGDVGVSGEPQQYPPGPCPSSTGLLEPPSDSGPLIRSNSMPTSTPPNLSVPPGIRGSHSFDEMMTSDEVFYPQGLRRLLRRQAAFEHSAAEAHAGEAEGYGLAHKNSSSPLGVRVGERSPGLPDHLAYGPYGTKVSMSEIATRKRRKKESFGDEDDSPGHCDSSCSGSVEMTGDYDFKQSSLDGARATPTGKGSFSAHSQSDSFDTCASMCSEDMALFTDAEGRKAAGNVISVIQHTNSLSRPNSFEKSESFEHPLYQASDKGPASQYSEQSDSDIFEDALSPESALLRTESMEQQQQQCDGDIPSLAAAAAASSPGQSYHIQHKLVRQPNIQVPEIRVTEEPDKPERDSEAPMTKESEKQQQQQQQQHVEEFQLPQRSDTLSQMPSEKLPPKKKRLRLTDMEHSSGESSFESTGTSLSRSPSQESNLSHCSSFSMSFDRDEALKSVSPTKQDEALPCGGGGAAKPSEFLTVPGSGHSGLHQQREMRRSSSEQAPCTLPTELPEMRSKSFDYGSLSPCRGGELYASASAMKERRRGYLVRQASLSVYPEAVAPEPGGADPFVKQESLDHGGWTGGSAHNCSRRAGGGGGSQLQQSVSEDSLQDEPPPLHRSQQQQQRLQPLGSSSDGEHPAHDVINQEVLQQYQSSAPFLSLQQQQLQKLQVRCASGSAPPRPPPPHEPQSHDGKSDPSAAPFRASPQNFGSIPSNFCSSSSSLPQQIQSVFAAQNLGPPASGLLVPVRIQTHVPSFGSVTYTSVSQLVVGGANMSALSHFLGHGEASAPPPPPRPLWTGSAPEHRPNTGIPLSLTSGTVSTTDASGAGAGSSKRVLSPASSLELAGETKQQKRVKEERMFGQMVKEMGAVELSGSEGAGAAEDGPSRGGAKGEDASDSASPPADKISVPVRSSAPHLPDLPRPESFTPPLQIVTDRPAGGRDSPEDLDVDESAQEPSSPQSMVDEDGTEDVDRAGSSGGGGGGAALLSDAVQPYVQFPSLRGGSRVSWCFLKYTKPSSSSSSADARASVYSSWCVNAFNPNPLNLSTKAALALLRSKQRSSTHLLYTTAAMAPPSAGKLVSSVAWKLRFDQLKPELMPVDLGHFGRPMKGAVSWDRSKEEQVEKEVSLKAPPGAAAAEPARIRIFEGGFKSNEEYVYVRGRGRGKYICEECGIRCKKPSMLKKHIRTHTDVRPYVCKFCNFAFKTKGNLTKHMKSKAHMKKCLELGVSMSSVEDTEAEEGDGGDEGQRSEKFPRGASSSDHQFSDVDDSEGDEDDDEDEDEDEYDGESTPRTGSRSGSPLPYAAVLSVAALAAAPPPPLPPRRPPDLLGHAHKPPLFGYFTTVPSIHVSAQAPPPPEGPRLRLLAPPPPPSSSSMMDEDPCELPPPPSSPSPGPDLCPSPLLSPASSPAARRYLSPRRDLSPRPLSPRSLSPRHLSPRRDLSPRGEGGAGLRRDLSPRRGHFSLLSPLPRPTSPGGRDYKRDLSPRGRHKAGLRPLSPRRGLHPLLHHHSQQGGARSLRPSADFAPLGRRRSGADMETDLEWQRPAGHHGNQPGPPHHQPGPPHHQPGPPHPQPGPPHQVLFSHLPLHSQLQVRSPFPMIPIGGIQMVQSVPPSMGGAPPSMGGAPPSQQGGAPPSQRGGAPPPRLPPLHKSTSEDSVAPGDASERGGGGGGGGGGAWPRASPRPSNQERGGVAARPEQEEGVQTCTNAIASLCLHSGGEEPGRAPPPPPLGPAPSSGPSPSDSQRQRRLSPSVSVSPPSPPPHPSPSQHFSGPELRPPELRPPELRPPELRPPRCCPSPSAPPADPPASGLQAAAGGGGGEAERSRDAS